MNADSLRPCFLLPMASGSALSLHLLRAGDTASLAVAATYAPSGAGTEMRLLTELDWNTPYLLRWTSPSGPRAAVYRTPQRSVRPAARLIGRYPESDSVPANLLCLQFRFDKPMRPDIDAWTRFHIRADSPGSEEIPYAWRQRCFWLDSGRELQLMIHPGRVKSGIDYGGPLLAAGRRYVLSIDAGLADAAGNLLPAAPVQRLAVFPDDHVIPHVESVTAAVAAGTREPLKLCFSEPMDHSGLLTGIQLHDREGAPLRYRLEVAPGARSCRLIPEQPWQAGSCSLHLDSEIRDLAFNSLRRRFEVRRMRDTRADRRPVRHRIAVH